MLDPRELAKFIPENPDGVVETNIPHPTPKKKTAKQPLMESKQPVAKKPTGVPEYRRVQKKIVEQDNDFIGTLAESLTDDPVLFEETSKSGPHLLSGKGTKHDKVKVDDKFDDKESRAQQEKDKPSKSTEPKSNPGEGGKGGAAAGDAASAVPELKKVGGKEALTKKGEPTNSREPGTPSTGSQQYKAKGGPSEGVIGFKSPDILASVSGAPTDSQLNKLEEGFEDPDEFDDEYWLSRGIDPHSADIADAGAMNAMMGTEGPRGDIPRAVDPDSLGDWEVEDIEGLDEFGTPPEATGPVVRPPAIDVGGELSKREKEELLYLLNNPNASYMPRKGGMFRRSVSAPQDDVLDMPRDDVDDVGAEIDRRWSDPPEDFFENKKKDEKAVSESEELRRRAAERGIELDQDLGATDLNAAGDLEAMMGSERDWVDPLEDEEVIDADTPPSVDPVAAAPFDNPEDEARWARELQRMKRQEQRPGSDIFDLPRDDDIGDVHDYIDQRYYGDSV